MARVQLSRAFSIALLLLSALLASSPAAAICVGCGANGKPPCYHLGNLVFDGSWFESEGVVIREISTVIAEIGSVVTIQQKYYRNGVLFNEEEYNYDNTGCGYSGAMSPYHPMTNPVFTFALDSNTPSNATVSTPVDISRFEIVDLETGAVIDSSTGGPFPAGSTFSRPQSAFPPGHRVLIAGVVPGGEIHGFMAVTRHSTVLSECAWLTNFGVNDSTQIRAGFAEIEANGVVRKYYQYTNGSRRVVVGTGVVLAPSLSLPGVLAAAMGLLLAGVLWISRRQQADAPRPLS